MQIKKTEVPGSSDVSAEPTASRMDQPPTITTAAFISIRRFFCPPKSSETALFLRQLQLAAGRQVALWCIHRQRDEKVCSSCSSLQTFLQEQRNQQATIRSNLALFDFASTY